MVQTVGLENHNASVWVYWEFDLKYVEMDPKYYFSTMKFFRIHFASARS